MKPAGMWRLLGRILRGAGVRDRLRLGLQVVGVALAVVCAMLAVTMPMVFGAERARLAAREPVPAQLGADGQELSTGVSLSPSDQLYRGQPLTFWSISVTAGTKLELPPGLSAWPAPGHLVLSPQLAADCQGDPALRARLPGGSAAVIDGTIGTDGLASPNELFAWVGVGSDDGPSVAGFGTDELAVAGLMQDNSTSAMIELIVLVGLPVVGFLLAASRMAAGTRAARTATLRLVGLSAAQCATLNGRMLAVTTAVGGAVGVLAYAPISAALGRSGVTGLAWFPGDTRVWWPLLVVIVAGLTLLGRVIGGASAGGGPGRRRRIPLALGVIPLGGVAVLIWIWYSAVNWGWQAIIALVVVTLGVVVLATSVASALAGRWARNDNLAPVTRLGLRLAGVQSGGTGIALGAVAVMISVAAFASALLGMVVRDFSSPAQSYDVGVFARHLATQQQAAVMGLLESAEYPAYAQTATEPNIMVASCASIHAMGGQDIDCDHGPIMLEASGGPVIYQPPKPGDKVQIPLTDGTSATVIVPAKTVTSDALGFNAVFVTPDEATWLAKASVVDFTFTVPSAGSSYDDLLGAVAQQAPDATTSTGGTDSEGLAFYEQQRAMLRVYTAAGFLFSLLALVLVGVGMSQDQLRSLTALQLVGLTRRQLRVAMALSKAFPVLVAVVPIWAAAGLSAQAVQASIGLGQRLVGAIWGQAAIFAVIGIAAMAVVGALMVAKLDLSVPDSRE